MNRDVERRLIRIEHERRQRFGAVRYDVSPEPEGAVTKADPNREMTVGEWVTTHCREIRPERA